MSHQTDPRQVALEGLLRAYPSLPRIPFDKFIEAINSLEPVPLLTSANTVDASRAEAWVPRPQLSDTELREFMDALIQRLKRGSMPTGPLGMLVAFELARALETGRIRPRTCRVCGCTDDDCLSCVERTGAPCSWVDEDLCSACVSSEDTTSD